MYSHRDSNLQMSTHSIRKIPILDFIVLDNSEEPNDDVVKQGYTYSS